jgi:hypothetical protein
VPIALIDRFGCYKANDAIQAAGQNLYLFNGFVFNLELGQVVPPEVGGDLRFVAEGDHGYLEPIGKAKLYLVTRPLPGTEPKKTSKPVVGAVFEAQYFEGTYQLHDDGRRSAKLTLKVDAEGLVTGEYVSALSGRKYEVTGKVLNPRHLIQFTVEFPQSKQTFQGWMFTRDARAFCGVCKMQEHEFGFYALRLEEE